MLTITNMLLSKMDDYLNYPKIIDDTRHIALRKILSTVAAEGLRDDHHFYISFITHAKGVKLSERVRSRYPDEITIVLQYQFQDLVVKDSFFSIRLSFDGISEVIIVPYEAITSFADPSVKFSLQFYYYPDHEDEIHAISEEETADFKEIYTEAVVSSNVIALDKFRKNRKKH